MTAHAGVELPVDLAPALRLAAEQLLAECGPAMPRPAKATRYKSRADRSMRRCYVCRGSEGKMGGHHLVPGDDSTVVDVHPRCHTKLHRRLRGGAS